MMLRPALGALLLSLVSGAALLVPGMPPGMPGGAHAQQLDLSHGGPIDITANDGIDWQQNERTVIARGNARAVRGNVTVIADRLIAHYRKKGAGASGAAAPGAAAPAPAAPAPAAPAPAAPSAPSGGIQGPDADTSGNEIYRVEAEGNVRISTPTDHAEGDRAIYDLDQAVLLMTGRSLKLTTPQDVLTARDSMEYWAQKHMAVARGNAVVLTSDGKRIAADTLVAYTTDTPRPGGPQPVKASTAPAGAPGAPPGAPSGAKASGDPLIASGKLQKVDAIGNVSVRTATETVTGDRGVYVPETGIARLAGNVRITRGQNQINGAEAEVNLKTGISTLLSGPAGRVQGLVLPNDSTNQRGAPGPGEPPQKGQLGAQSAGSKETKP
jgi:lipopolysaccharide export system protein LptA